MSETQTNQPGGTAGPAPEPSSPAPSGVLLVDIENAMLRILQATGLFTTTASYAGEFYSEDWRSVMSQFPAAWIAFAGEYQAPEKRTNGYDEYLEFSVIIAVRNLRDEKSRRHGRISANEAGAYTLIETVKAVLSRQSLDLAIDPLEPQKVEPILIGQAGAQSLALYKLDFRTRRFRALDETTATPFNRSSVHWSDNTTQEIHHDR